MNFGSRARVRLRRFRSGFGLIETGWAGRFWESNSLVISGSLAGTEERVMSKEFEKFKKAVKVIVSVPKKKVIKKPKVKKVSKKTAG